jgi:hypothetical protein
VILLYNQVYPTGVIAKVISSSAETHLRFRFNRKLSLKSRADEAKTGLVMPVKVLSTKEAEIMNRKPRLNDD